MIPYSQALVDRIECEKAEQQAREQAARDCAAWLPSGRLWIGKADLPSRMRHWAETRTARRVLWGWNIAMMAVVIGLLVTA